MGTVRIRIVELMEQKRNEGATVTQEIISKATGIPQGTLSRWAGNKVDRLDKDIMAKLCEYFDCEIGELIVLERNKMN